MGQRAVVRIRRAMVAVRRRLTHDRVRDRGATPVELAIAFPAILILTFASIQVGAWFLARAVALNAAQVAVSSTRTLNGVSPEAGEGQAGEFIAGTGGWLVGWDVEVSRDDEQVTATVTGNVVSVIPGIGWTVSQTARGPVERFVEEDAP
ncbi:TadE/TadG family type IV pilus assembly protein [Phytohabitans kaempferiae]|uniref:TadE/TadG family type IV pilus assembly protein n=1 Tax=Phytohabitans kaempferiae TaxID=1620943 RepID=A0ABV6LV23_9ACTN